MQQTRREKTLQNLLFIGPPLISVFLIDRVVTDPVNTPKFFMLGVISTGILAILFVGLRKSEVTRNRYPLGILGIFLTVSISTLWTSSSPLTQSIYGIYGRNNGFLTYFFFSILFLGSLFISVSKTHERIIQGLFIAGVINILYCGWVIVFGDFLSWNNPYGNILGTFGNPNFIGSFLGIFFCAWVSFLFAPTSTKFFRLASAVVLPLTAIEIYLSHAIQGRVLMVGGSAFVIFFWLRFKFKSKIILWGYSVFSLCVAILALAGSLQIGPLTSLIYKNSVSLRGQYWLAAWNTGKTHPWTGVGFDSLGDWYRRMRDIRALELPGIDTVINTAHNVPLDLFSFGGWPLLLSYIVLLLFTLLKICQYGIKLRNYDKLFVALTVSWFCYQTQSLISINQIGLGLWGWLLSGAILSYVNILEAPKDFTKEMPRAGIRVKSKKNNEILTSGIVASFAMVIGGLLAAPPLSSDMKWMSAQQARSATALELSLQPSYLNPESTQKYLMTVQLFEQSNLNELSHKYLLKALNFNPNVYDSWRVLGLLRNSSATEKELAFQNMKRLDPLNPTLKNRP